MGEATANNANIPMVGMGASPFGLQMPHQTSATSALANSQVQQRQSNDLPIVRFCPKCGKKVDPIHSFCPYCCFDLQEIHAMTSPTQQQSCSPAGGPAPQQPNELAIVRFCPKCGKKVDRAHSFCPYCCFDLQEIHALSSQALTTVSQKATMPCDMTSHTQQQSCSSADSPALQKPKYLGSE